jgi:uncharacterized protein (TIRG00374 family)
MKKLHALLLLLGFAFLACLVWRIGPLTLWDQLVLLGWGLAPFILMEFVAECIHTVAWRNCLSGPNRQLSWFRVFQIRMAGYAINYLTPTAAMGGEATKAAFLYSDYSGPEAFTGVLAGKLCAGAGHLLFVLAGSVFVIASVTLPRAVWGAMFLSTGLVAIGMTVFLLLQKYGKLGGLLRWLAARKFAGRALKNYAQRFSEVDETLKTFYRERPRSLALAVGWHMFGHATGILQTWWFFGFLHQPISAMAATAVWVLGMWFDMLTFAMPLNLGTLEGSRVFLFKAIGLSAAQGMTYGICQRLAQLCCACFGLMNYAWLASKNGHSLLFNASEANITKIQKDEPSGFKAKPVCQ